MNPEVQQVIREATGNLSGRSVFGDPIERDGITIITAARVRGGGGGGGGSSPGENGHEPQAGWGGGASAVAEPVGAYVLSNGGVRWYPAVDVNAIARRAVVAWVLVVLAAMRFSRRRERHGSRRHGRHGG